MVVAWLLATACPLLAQTTGVITGPGQALLPGVNPGELLLGELGCVSCHDGPAAVKTRLNSRPGLSG